MVGGGGGGIHFWGPFGLFIDREGGGSRPPARCATDGALVQCLKALNINGRERKFKVSIHLALFKIRTLVYFTAQSVHK